MPFHMLDEQDSREQMHPGGVAVVPSNATHSGRALSACRFVDVFQPVREDYRV